MLVFRGVMEKVLFSTSMIVLNQTSRGRQVSETHLSSGNKTFVSFHCTGRFIGILKMVYFHPHITG